MADMQFIGPSAGPRFRFAVEPAHNALCSLCLLNQDLGGLHEWVGRTAAALPARRLELNEEACEAAAFLHAGPWPDFAAWVEDFTGRDPQSLARSYAERLLLKARMFLGAGADIPGVQDLFDNRDVFLDLSRRICEGMGCKAQESDFERSYRRLQDPAGLQRRAASHFRLMWREHLAAEWRRVEPMIRDSVAAFESLDFRGKSPEDKLLQIIDRDRVPDPWAPWLSSVQEVVFIPSAHIGPYLLMIGNDEHTAHIVGGARIPQGATAGAPTLGRSELLMRLNALSDETRLRILELVARRGEMTAQSVIDSLGMSQSSASRHLSQLAATGYLSARVAEGTKRFSLHADRLDDTFRALKDALARRGSGVSGKEA